MWTSPPRRWRHTGEEAAGWAWVHWHGALALSCLTARLANEAAQCLMLCTTRPPPHPHRLKKSRGDDPLAFIDKAKGQQQGGGEGGYDYV